MKSNILAFVLMFLFGSMFTSCLTDECTEQREFFRYDPVRMTLSQIRQEITVSAERKLENPGKLYYYNDILFINEMGKGIHVYDNHNPSNPVYLTYYNIPGNFDIAIKNDVLYADNAMDIVALDITDMMNPQVVSRLENFKDQYIAENNSNYQYVIYYNKALATQILDCNDRNFNRNDFFDGDVFFTSENSGDIANNSGNGNSSGIGGSTARFTIVNDHLYAVTNSKLRTINIENPTSPELGNVNQMAWGIETIFPYKNNLFIGSNAGMYIFGLDNPEYPNQISRFEHARACDPVVVNGDFAYVTLRNGSRCTGTSNQLDIIDISNLNYPSLIKTHPMLNPHGLSIDGDIMYLSEGRYGLKVLDVSNKEKVKELTFDENIKSTDVIYLGNNHLLSIGSDGFYQFDVTDKENIKLLSHISVQK